MKKLMILFLVIAITIAVGCSNETSNQNGQSQIDAEFIENEEITEDDYFAYEETETNIVKIEEKIEPIETNKIKTVNKIEETKTEEVKTENNETIEKVEINTNEIKVEDKSDIEKIIYISKTGKKYHLENCRTLRGEKETMDLEEAIKTGYEACKVCNPDAVESE